MGKAPRVYTGAYQDDSDGEGFNLTGAELKACYEVGAPLFPPPFPGPGEVAPPHPAVAWRDSPGPRAGAQDGEGAGEGTGTATARLFLQHALQHAQALSSSSERVLHTARTHSDHVLVAVLEAGPSTAPGHGQGRPSGGAPPTSSTAVAGPASPRTPPPGPGSPLVRNGRGAAGRKCPRTASALPAGRLDRPRPARPPRRSRQPVGPRERGAPADGG